MKWWRVLMGLPIVKMLHLIFNSVFLTMKIFLLSPVLKINHGF
jgi:hypothetical protein